MLNNVTPGIVTAGIVNPGKFAPIIENGGINVKLGIIVNGPHPTVQTIDDANDCADWYVGSDGIDGGVKPEYAPTINAKKTSKNNT